MEGKSLTAGTCCYYSYVDFGPAMVNGNLHIKENIYRSSGLVKLIKFPGNDMRNFKAYYTDYQVTKTAGGFEIITLGPFDTEAVAYTALQNKISELKDKGYKEITSAHKSGTPPIHYSSECLKC